MADGPEQVIVADNPALSQRAADWLIARISQAMRARGRCSLALAGGSTPRPIYADFGARAKGVIPWDKVDIYFGDERAVAPDHTDSNYRMAQEALLSHLPLGGQQVHRMEAERSDRERAADEYAALLPARLDVLILGMGPDGHTASLFPGSPALSEATRLVVPVIGPKPPPERLTITPPVIERARSIAVVATGRDKAGVAAQALEGGASPRDIPISLARRGTWFLDVAAASLLKGTGSAA